MEQEAEHFCAAAAAAAAVAAVRTAANRQFHRSQLRRLQLLMLLLLLLLFYFLYPRALAYSGSSPAANAAADAGAVFVITQLLQQSDIYTPSYLILTRYHHEERNPLS